MSYTLTSQDTTESLQVLGEPSAGQLRMVYLALLTWIWEGCVLPLLCLKMEVGYFFRSKIMSVNDKGLLLC